MFNWRKKLLSSLDIKKQEKLLRKKHSVEVPRLVSKRLFNINSNTNSYSGGDVSIGNKPFTEDERKNYDKIRAEQIKNKEPVEVQVPSTAIANARFLEDEGKIYITYVGGGGEYVFKGNKADWLNFMNSPSKGRYVQHIMKLNNQAPRSWYS